MGKWTAEHYDNVLGAKMRSLVSGAIKRARLEKVEPMISYETFVEDLDRGDSFTTSLIEVLVKEIAERRFRQNTGDRGLIADRTARSLRRLSSPAAVYRERGLGRGTGGRRALDPTDYLSQPPEELDVDDDDELGSYDAFVPVVEGARLNTDLYEAYRSQHSWSNSSIPYVYSIPHASPPLSVPSTEPPTSDRVLPPLIEAPPRANVWLPPASGLLHGSLSRQNNSIRRPARSRAADFNEFTTHRRSLARQFTVDDDPATRPEGPSGTAPLSDNSTYSLRSDDISSTSRTSSQARRFFPFGRARRFEIIPSSRSAPSVTEDWLFPNPPVWTSASERAESTRTDDDRSDERSQAPRLRRGGLRAPEAMLPRSGFSSWLGLPPQEEPSIVGRSLEDGENMSPTEQTDPVIPRPVSASEIAAQSIGSS
ncbi:hypothetical protein EDD17DRAFT_45917 [Pisolithus thermaeus]|nr:hypothetical protein EV401DRAFT_1903177 [Pisolithus croceorrhizus]KAI6166246.1 hypothetical protein EDD17DRAFT_45917 [Pisolithus thermaeus]